MGEFKLNISLGTANLCMMVTKKNNLLTGLVGTATMVTTLIKEKGMLRHLRKRREEQK